jgi:hypothetical protein
LSEAGIAAMNGAVAMDEERLTAAYRYLNLEPTACV